MFISINFMLEMIINIELQVVSEWVKENKMVLNVSKTSCMIVQSNYNFDTNPVINIKMNNITINQVSDIKLLTVDNKSSWKKTRS